MTVRSFLESASFRWPQDPVNGIAQGRRRQNQAETATLRHSRDIPLRRSRCAPGYRDAPRTSRKLDVAVAIADDEGSLQVDGMFAGGRSSIPVLRLAAIAAVGGRVRAIVYGVETGASGFKLLGHEFVDRAYKRFWKIAAANAGLICDDDHRQPRLI